ncbi:MAG: response regulator transcription factor [Cyanobacteria bacterium P01_H01_bin.15]
MQILIVEDDSEIAQLLAETLRREGFSCETAVDGEAGLVKWEERQPDLVILDLMLPKLDGLEVCTRIRQTQAVKDPYIMMLTARGEEIDRVIGLSTGADDYLVKPFSPREVVARVRALLRRSLRHDSQESANVVQSQHFRIDAERHVVERLCEEPENLDLTALEFNLFTTFVANPGRVWSRTQLIDKLWGGDFFGDERVVDTHIRRLRKKVEPDPAHPNLIQTVGGAGYKFEDETP